MSTARGAQSVTEQADTLDDLLRRRHSSRAFLDAPVADDVVERILLMAQRTATWCNVQPWHVIRARGETLARIRAELGEAVRAGERGYDLHPPDAYEGVYRDRRRACGFALYDSVGIAHDDGDARVAQAMLNYDFFGAPEVLFVTAETRLGHYAYVDAGAYIANLVLAAESLGAATIVQASTAEYSAALRRSLSLPETERFVASIAIGYEDDAHPINAFRTARAPLTEVVRWAI